MSNTETNGTNKEHQWSLVVVSLWEKPSVFSDCQDGALVTAERPVCTVKSPSSHSTPGLREAETARESQASSIMASWSSQDGRVLDG